MPKASYTTISDRSQAEIVEKKSKFISVVVHVETEEAALAVLEEVRAAHRMARHHVYAYVLREGGRVRYSDDGEPQKTAGLPTLESIQHAGLTDVIVITTRYFGGTLLGTGGLVRAYTSAAQAALESAEVVVVTRCVEVKIQLAYTLYEQAVRIGEACGACVADTLFTDEVIILFRLAEGTQQPLLEKISELSRGQAIVAVSDQFDAAL